MIVVVVLLVQYLAFDVGNRENGIDSDLGHLSLETVDNFGTQSSGSGHDQRLEVGLRELNTISNLCQMCYSDITRFLITTSNSDRVNALLQQLLRLLKQRTSQHYYTSGTITNLIILRF